MSETSDLFSEYDEKVLQEKVTLSVTKKELLLIDWGRRALIETYTRHQRIHGDLHALLGKLPEVAKKPEP